MVLLQLQLIDGMAILFINDVDSDYSILLLRTILGSTLLLFGVTRNKYVIINQACKLVTKLARGIHNVEESSDRG